MTAPTYPLPFARQSAAAPVPHDVFNGIEAWVEYVAGFVTVAAAAVVHSSGSVSVPNGPGSGTGAWNAGRTYPTFDTVDYDPTGMSALSGSGHSNQVLTAVQGGLYIAFGYGQFGANATGFRDISLDIGGDAANPIVNNQIAAASATFPTYTFAAMFQQFSAGQQIALRVDQNSGGALAFLNAKLALARIALS
jgi:hypothetical protein